MVESNLGFMFALRSALPSRKWLIKRGRVAEWFKAPVLKFAGQRLAP